MQNGFFSMHSFRFLSKLATCVTLVFATSFAAGAQEFEKNILTGGPSGTYIQIGRDLSELAASCGRTLTVRESAGSLENFLGVRKRRNTQFGIVQSDVLEYMNTFASDDPAVARAIYGVRIAFPLYNEEVHLLARRDISELPDLSGRTVAVGVEDSGTFLTASLVLDLTGIEPAERVAIGPNESLQALLAGDIDAFFYVAGAPTQLFLSEDIDPEAFHLVPIEDPTLRSVYTPARIAAGVYPFQTDAVDLIAVKAVLMTFEYDPGRNAYHAESCRAVSDLAHLVMTRFDELRASGHEKWQQVDLNDLPPGWDVGQCINAGLDPNYDMACEGSAVAEPVPGSSANAAYRERICDVIGC